jgi:RNA polymerase sigma-70 factor (ECF subfamily)
MGLSVNKTIDEADLVARSRGGDLEAFNALVGHHQAGLYNLCLRMLASGQAAEDAAQEAFISAYRRLDSFRGGSFRAWLYRIGINACYDEMRRRRARPAVSLDAGREVDEQGLDVADPGVTLDEHVERLELAGALQEALNSLPPDQRLAVILCDVQGMDYAEIARVSGVALGTVKSRIARGRAGLRAFLRQRGELLPSRLRQSGEGT